MLSRGRMPVTRGQSPKDTSVLARSQSWRRQRSRVPAAVRGCWRGRFTPVYRSENGKPKEPVPAGCSGIWLIDPPRKTVPSRVLVSGLSGNPGHRGLSRLRRGELHYQHHDSRGCGKGFEVLDPEDRPKQQRRIAGQLHAPSESRGQRQRTSAARDLARQPSRLGVFPR